jgi:hypothetical protein
MSDTTQVISKRPVLCPTCGHYSAPDVVRCTFCGEALGTREIVITRELTHVPHILSVDRPGQDYFALDANAILQFLPSGQVFSLSLERPVILGRASVALDDIERVDLSELNAMQHGVSRQHCRLRREGLQLVVTDLHTTNGTYLNDRRLEAGRDAIVLHGDKLILGTLHLIVTFSTLNG